MSLTAINIPHLGINIGTQDDKKLSSDIIAMSRGSMAYNHRLEDALGL